MNINLLVGSCLNYAYNNMISHVPAHWVRKGFLKLFNRNIHPSAKILMHVRILNFWKVEIGARVVINQYCLIDCRRHPVIIEKDVDIGPYTRIWTLGHQPDSADHEVYGSPVIIKDHAWIASGVTVLPGVTIERGAVIGAASVVHKSVPEKHIVAGNPAKFIRLRNNELTYQLHYTPILE